MRVLESRLGTGVLSFFTSSWSHTQHDAEPYPKSRDWKIGTTLREACKVKGKVGIWGTEGDDTNHLPIFLSSVASSDLSQEP